MYRTLVDDFYSGSRLIICLWELDGQSGILDRLTNKSPDGVQVLLG